MKQTLVAAGVGMLIAGAALIAFPPEKSPPMLMPAASVCLAVDGGHPQPCAVSR